MDEKYNLMIEKLPGNYKRALLEEKAINGIIKNFEDLNSGDFLLMLGYEDLWKFGKFLNVIHGDYPNIPISRDWVKFKTLKCLLLGYYFDLRHSLEWHWDEWVKV